MSRTQAQAQNPQAQAQDNKKIKASLNLSAIGQNEQFMSGLNRTLVDVYTLATAENKLKTATDNFKTSKGYKLTEKMSEDDKHAMTQDETIKAARREVKNCKAKAQGRADMLLIKYTDIDFTQDDSTALLTTSTLESILKNTGALTGDIKDCKTKAQDTAINLYKTIRSNLAMVLDRRTQAMARRAKGSDKLTYRESKEIANNSLDYILAFTDGLILTGLFEYEKTVKGYRQLASKF